MSDLSDQQQDLLQNNVHLQQQLYFQQEHHLQQPQPSPASSTLEYINHGSGGQDDQGRERHSVPPVTYMANMIANHLMRSGASMFGRLSDANCILLVGTRRYYVHVQMLASRSPTFRRIFDDMIANQAWGPRFNLGASTVDDAEGESELDSPSSIPKATDLDEESGIDEPDDMDCDGYNDGEDELDYGEDDSDEDFDLYDEFGQPIEYTDDDESEEVHCLPSLGSSQFNGQLDQLNEQMVHSLRIKDGQPSERVQTLESATNPGTLTEATGTDNVEDLSLPELSVTFADPEGSRFDELLYWLYTGDSDRWLGFFTVENYASILQNIIFLNIVTRTVLEICLTYESRTSAHLGLQGMALAVLCYNQPGQLSPHQLLQRQQFQQLQMQQMHFQQLQEHQQREQTGVVGQDWT